MIERHGSGLVVDNFAGGGGASTGIEAALGRPIDYAINHDPEAIAMHKVNHPATKHLVTNVMEIDPVRLAKGREIGLAWFSPDCTYHSKARGGKPFRDRDIARRRRGLAWSVTTWAKLVRPQVIMLENVEEFADWGPLLPDGKICPVRRGMTFRRWHRMLENLGYQVDMRELRACDYGAPTTRKRLFVIARCDGQEIVFPEATHGTGRKLQPYRTAADCIDWSIPCPSIFERKRPLAEATLRRIARGIDRYVINNPQPFIVPVNMGRSREHEKSTSPNFVGESHDATILQNRRSVDATFPCSLVAPVLTEHANASSPRCWTPTEPMRTQCANVKGGHFALVSAFLAQHNTGATGHHATEPLSTIVSRGTQQQLVTSHILKLKGADRSDQPVDMPLHTIQTGGHYGEVRAFLLKYYGTEQDPRLEEPLSTITTKDRFGLVTIQGEPYAIVDIGMRMLTPRELYRAQSFPDTYIIDPEINGKPLTKTAQVRMCGNSVPPAVAEALVQANLVDQGEESQWQLERVRA